MEDEIKRIIAEEECIDFNNITPEMVILDIGDSLDAAKLVVALEDKFNLEIPDEDMQKLVTVGDVITYIKAKKGESER